MTLSMWEQEKFEDGLSQGIDIGRAECEAKGRAEGRAGTLDAAGRLYAGEWHPHGACLKISKLIFPGMTFSRTDGIILGSRIGLITIEEGTGYAHNIRRMAAGIWYNRGETADREAGIG